MSGLWIVVFAVCCALLLVLPFAPAIGWARRTASTEAQPVDAGGPRRTRAFGGAFDRRIDLVCGIALSRARDTSGVVRTCTANDDTFIVVGPQIGARGYTVNEAEQRAWTIVAACDLTVAERQMLSREAWSEGSITLRAASVVRAVRAKRSIDIGAGAVVLRWADADDTLRAASDARLFGRIGAGTSIELAPGVQFERLSAPIIWFGAQHPRIVARGAPIERAPFAPPNARRSGAGTLHVAGDLTVPRGTIVRESLIVTGALVVGRDARIEGSLQAHGGVTLDERAEIAGSVCSRAAIRIGKRCRVTGVVVSDTQIAIDADAVCGSPQSPATVSAAQITVAPGAAVFGAVWACKAGRVLTTQTDEAALRAA